MQAALSVNADRASAGIILGEQHDQTDLPMMKVLDIS